MDNWRAVASIKNLRLRGEILQKIRYFFVERQVLEVETPLACTTTALDPYLHSMQTQWQATVNSAAQTLYLQTSPEFAMKRLLASGSGSIYQICKAFRNYERGMLHNPEFSILEWYRIDFDEHALMQEADELLQQLLGLQPAEKYSYQQIFEDYCQFDPHNVDEATLMNCIKQNNLLSVVDKYDYDICLQLLMSHVIEPHLGKNNRATMIYDFPGSQAALARLHVKQPNIAHRFEIYVAGMELANGFYELADAEQQQQRFEVDLQRRKNLGYDADLPIDTALLQALQHGLPNCAGIALGVDRLIMLAAGADCIEQVLSFPAV